MLTGTLATTSGACPVCGRDVDHALAFNGRRRVETYACFRCGETAYTLAVA